MNDFRDTRLIEAFEYIDPKYINEVGAGLKLRSVYSAEEEHTKPTFRTHVKQLATLAACILLLSIVSPLVSYIAEVISNFNAGAGSSNTSELLTEPETTNGMYDKYILTEEDLAELNEAYFKYNFQYELKNNMYTEEQIEQIRNSKYGKFAETVEAAMRRDTYENSHFYFGKFGDSIVVAFNGMASIGQHFELDGYRFRFRNSSVYVCHGSTFYLPIEAYEKGFLNFSDVQILYDMYIEYFAGISDQLKIAPQEVYQGPVVLSYEESREIVWEYIRSDEYIQSDGEPNNLDQIFNVKCYGKFDDVYAVMIGSNAMTFKDEERVETVGGINFNFDTEQKMYIYYWGRFMSIDEAYDLKWIDIDDLSELKKHLN